VGQREHMARLGIHRKCWSECMCLSWLVAISPRRANWVCVPRGMRSVGTSPPTPAAGVRPAGGPVAGAQLSTSMC
jgi:hypothetical protein